MALQFSPQVSCRAVWCHLSFLRHVLSLSQSCRVHYWAIRHALLSHGPTQAEAELFTKLGDSPSFALRWLSHDQPHILGSHCEGSAARPCGLSGEVQR